MARQAGHTIGALLLALAFSLLPADAQTLHDDSGDHGSAVAPDVSASRSRSDDDPAAPADYGAIMDDVNDVIDAMDKPIKPSSPTSPAAAESAPPAPAHNLNAKQSSSGPAQARSEKSRTSSPIVVELFTSQGCAACPPAEDLLADLAGRRDVLVLSWHVDYWDYLGWTDSFAQPAFSARQKGYNLSRGGSRSLFTPQFFIGGQTMINDLRPAHLMAAIDLEKAESDHVSVTRKGTATRSEIELTGQGSLPPSITVQMVRYLPKRIIPIEAGDNQGRNLSHYNVVVGNEVLAKWDGRGTFRLTVTLGAGKARNLPPDTRHALLVQDINGPFPGEILATILLD
ncbi:MAG: DUF1223 domain-containing protein [Paracoccus sp. (in: a-proteobacteria)]